MTAAIRSHNSVVNGDAYELAHAYAKATGGRQTVRRSGTTLPNGDALTYSYSASGGAFDDALSRVSGISHGATSVVRYAYDGAGFVSRTTLPTISMVNGTTTPTLGTWAGLDRHNRPIIWKWYWASNSNVTAYDEELGWDRADNVLWRKDHFHDNFDVAYDIDELNRVTRAEEGTVTAGAITATSRDQSWTLDHLGNWDRNLLDLNGDGVFTGTDELDEARTHNTVNELLARDIDNDSTDDFTQTNDALGNLTDDGQNYTYTWDAFGRLREIRNRTTTDLVQELRYNGLGFLIAEHYDADDDGDVDGSDPWYHHVWDERWRLVATFRAGDSDPKEQYVLHNAGFDGRGGSSYINDVVLRDRDANTNWDDAADGTLEERLFYLTNWRHDVVTLLDSSRRQVEHTRYSAYGTPFAMPAGDTDSDGDCDATDITQIDTWIAGTIYDLRGDLNLDGVVNATDKSIATGTYQGTTLGRGALSSHGNRLRWAGMQDLLGAHTITHVRNRAYSAELGRWLSRDPLGYVDGVSSVQMLRSSPHSLVDPHGLTTIAPGGYVSFPFGHITYIPGSTWTPGGVLDAWETPWDFPNPPTPSGPGKGWQCSYYFHAAVRRISVEGATLKVLSLLPCTICKRTISLYDQCVEAAGLASNTYVEGEAECTGEYWINASDPNFKFEIEPGPNYFWLGALDPIQPGQWSGKDAAKKSFEHCMHQLGETVKDEIKAAGTCEEVSKEHSVSEPWGPICGPTLYP